MLKKIFISGAGGFIGSELVKGFKKLKYEIHALDKSFNYSFEKNDKIFYYKSDLNTFKKKKLNKLDYFVHAAAITNYKSNILKKNLYNDNLILTKKSLKLAKNLNIKKFYFLSSTGIYRGNKDEYFNEKSKIFITNDYAKSKISSEIMVKNFCEKNNIDFKILRLGNIFSGLEKKTWSRKNVSIFQDWINRAKKNYVLKTQSLKSKRDWTYVKDIPLAIHSIIISRNTNTKIINLVSPYIRKDIQIMKLILKKMNRKIQFKEELPSYVRHNASFSIYLKNFRFNKWTSPTNAIKKIILEK